MIHPDTELRFKSPEIGYGVFATAPIPRGTVVWTLCPLDQRVDRGQRERLNPTSRELLDLYAYVNSAGEFILCWDHGRFVNHSCDPAMVAIGEDHEIAVRDLKVGDELTCDYGALNLLETLSCHCGALHCRGSIAGDALSSDELVARTDARAAAALEVALTVDQPLLDVMRQPNRFVEMATGLVDPPSVGLCRPRVAATA